MSIVRSFYSVFVRARSSGLVLSLLVVTACAGSPGSDSAPFLRGQTETAGASFVWTRGAAPFTGSNWSGGIAVQEESGEAVSFLLAPPPSPGPQRALTEYGASASEPSVSTGVFIAGLRLAPCKDNDCGFAFSGIDSSLVVVFIDGDAGADTCVARRLGGAKTRGFHLMRATARSNDETRADEEACAAGVLDDVGRRLCACQYAGDALTEVPFDTPLAIRRNTLRAPVVVR